MSSTTEVVAAGNRIGTARRPAGPGSAPHAPAASPGGTTVRDREDEIIEFMITFGVADTLLRIHVDDRTGHCRVCCAGPQAGRAVHPCRLRVLAEKAQGRHSSHKGSFQHD